MFYSQFLLAKKGPLGTIWIAAHLERKLRKNQVADTDIGVSVDSILFPEAPIALRLSSHLLLGVVRIYSRKVNYLFHDCSEALLKIKQAFRSTAVDLPPEESTAPYHSITLPETFHLDDFELPDSPYGNFIDHHVSTKEQITLQDTLNTTGCSTSRFGLDERFGDGDASQIGLDLDEELFLEKALSPQDALAPLDSEEDMVHRDQPSVHLVGMDVDERQSATPKYFSEFLSNNRDKHVCSDRGDLERNHDSFHQHGYNPQTPNLNEVFTPDVHGPHGFGADDVASPDLTDIAQAPSTPGLMEEAIPANVQEMPALSPQERMSISTNVEAAKPDTSCHPSLESADTARTISSPTLVLSEPSGLVHMSGDAELEYGHKGTDNLQNEFLCNEMNNLQIPDQNLGNGEAILPEATRLDGPVPESCHLEESHMGKTLDKCLDNPEQVILTSDLPNANEAASEAASEVTMLSQQGRVLVENALEASVIEPSCLTQTPEGEALHVSKSSTALQGENSPSAHVIDGDEQSAGVVLKDSHLDHPNCSSSSEFPEPEKMVLAPTGDMNFPSDIGQLTTEKGVTESDGSVDRINKVSGRKRRLMESTPNLQSCSSAKLSGRQKLRRNNEYVPDDDDLLASILVGRRTSTLRMGPTPISQKVASLKRPRLNPRVGMHKRKVLLDDAMVLHADSIRQQLISTEDIRRIRKKAPCTRPEIWMIEKCSREEEIFDEFLLTGISADLYGLYTRSYALNDNPSSQIGCKSHVEPFKEAELSRNSGIVRETYGKEKDERVAVISSEVHGEVQGFSGTAISGEAHTCKDVVRCDIQEHIESQPNVPELPIVSINGICTVSITEMDERHRKNAQLDSVSHSENEIAGLANGLCRQPDKQSAQNLANSLDDSMVINDRDPHFSESVPTEGHVSAEDAVRDRMVDDMFLPFMTNETLVRAEDPCHAMGTSTMEEFRGHISVEGVNGEALLDCSIPGVQSSSSDVLMEIVQPAGMPTITGQQVVEEAKEVRLVIAADGEVAVEKLLNNVNGLPSEMVSLESAQAAAFRIETNTDFENVPSAVGENSGMQEFNQEDGLDVENAPMDFVVTREPSDFCSAIVGSDTGFLNVDDEADFDEADIDVPNPEETQPLEDSGWSSRTRGVARYLKSLFDDEYGCGRKVFAMDQLLTNKTRKEASRMFFETLVLKTRDYIDVEQEKPFDYVQIRPRIKLLKSDF